MNGDNLGVELKGLVESNKNRFAEALESFISVDHARALVTMGVGSLQRCAPIHSAELEQDTAQRSGSN